jgi:hypothetical protein
MNIFSDCSGSDEEIDELFEEIDINSDINERIFYKSFSTDDIMNLYLLMVTQNQRNLIDQSF